MKYIKNINKLFKSEKTLIENVNYHKTTKKLEQLRKEFKKFREWGYNQHESAERAVDVVFSGEPIKPHIYKDEYGGASHLFLKKQVLFFNGSIYNESTN